MNKLDRNQKTLLIVILVVSFISVSTRLVNVEPINNYSVIRFYIGAMPYLYILFYAVWAVSIHNRILQSQVRRYMIYIALLMILWMGIRTIKYEFLTDKDYIRYFWYLYYIPILFIPLFTRVSTFFINKPENYLLSKKIKSFIKILYVIPSVLFLLIITNDYHQLAFKFNISLQNTNNGYYSHGIVYILSMIWVGICTFVSLIAIIRNTRVEKTKKRIWLPLIPLFILIIYCSLYLISYETVKLIFGDLASVCCLLVVAIFEALIQSRLIPSNINYKDILKLSSINTIIVDDTYRRYFTSFDAKNIALDTAIAAENKPQIVEERYKLSSYKIKGGRVLWLEDISEILSILDKLEKTQVQLKEEISIVRENFETEERIHKLNEKNKIYDKLYKEISPQVILIKTLLNKLDSVNNENERRILLKKLLGVGTYTKRRSNLVFLCSNRRSLPIKELELSIQEMVDILNLIGINAASYIPINCEISTTCIMNFYDLMEAVIEKSFASLEGFLVRIYEKSDEIFMNIIVKTNEDLSTFRSDNIDVYKDDEGNINLTISSKEER